MVKNSKRNPAHKVRRVIDLCARARVLVSVINEIVCYQQIGDHKLNQFYVVKSLHN